MRKTDQWHHSEVTNEIDHMFTTHGLYPSRFDNNGITTLILQDGFMKISINVNEDNYEAFWEDISDGNEMIEFVGDDVWFHLRDVFDSVYGYYQEVQKI